MSKFKTHTFKVGDRLLQPSTDKTGVVTGIRKDGHRYMELLYDGEKESCLCVNSEEYFKLLFRQPTKEQKSEWESLWDIAADE